MNDPRELSPGTVFAGDFTIIRHLGEGSLSSVYAVSQRSTGKERALKLFYPHLIEPAHCRSFEQEIALIARIESVHVADVISASVDTETGAPWIAMELLRGEPLADLVERFGGLPRVEVMTILREVCHAVGAAHALHLIHGSLTSRSLFHAEGKRDDGKRCVKVRGFEKTVFSTRGQADAGVSKWELRWMAPEVVQLGRRRDPQGDVWAIGLIAFFLFTGRDYWRTPVNADNPILELVSEMLLHPLSKASERARELKRPIPPGFDAWFAQAVERDPKKRFPDAKVAYERLVSMVKTT
jgi:serine/threonine-protein kinase